MLELLAAFDFSNLWTFIYDHIGEIILGSQLIPVDKSGMPYQPLIKALYLWAAGRKTVDVPTSPGSPMAPGTPATTTTDSPSWLTTLLPMLIPFIQQLAGKPPVATVVTPPDPATLPTDPNSMVVWLMKLLNAPEQPTVTTPIKPHIENPTVSPVEVRWEHFTGCFQAMVDLYPDFDISAVSSNGNTEVKKVARVVKP